MSSSATSIWSWILYISKNKNPWRKSRLHKNGWTRHIWHSSHGFMFKMIVFGICVQTSDVQVVKFKINLWQPAGYCHVMVFTSCCHFWVFSNKSTTQLKRSSEQKPFYLSLLSLLKFLQQEMCPPSLVDVFKWSFCGKIHFKNSKRTECSYER